MEFVTNYWALIVAVVASIILGMLWYGPVFGKAWMKSIGKRKEDFTDKKGMQKGMVVSIIGAFVMAWILSHVMQALYWFKNMAGMDDVAGELVMDMTASHGLRVGFFVWLGFVAPVMAATTFYDGRKLDYFMVNGGYRLAELLAFGLILAWMM